MPSLTGWTNKEFTGKTFIGFILDRSNSMTMLKQVTISGFNEWLHTQRADPSACLFTLTLFDTVFDTVISNEPIQSVADLDGTRYQPERGGNTALYDAIAHCVGKMEANVKTGDRVLMVIQTDGQENSSREYDATAIRRLIKEHEARGNWTFTYLSASPSAFIDATKIGTQTGNVAQYDATLEGTSKAFRRANSGTSSFRGQAAPQSAGFYEGDSGDEDSDDK